MGQVFSTTKPESTPLTTSGKRKASFDSSQTLKKACKDATFESATPEVIITEQDVGILAFVNPNLKGFSSIMKYRAEDFLVNEVNLDGKIIRLTSLDPPVIPERQKFFLSDAEFDAKIAGIISPEFAKELRNVLNNPNDITVSARAKNVEKASRIDFYNAIECNLDAPLMTECLEGVLIARWKNPDDTEKPRKINFDITGGEYVSFYVQKSGVDTMGAQFSYAGTKDARAVTVQEMTLFKCDPRYLYDVRNELAERQIYIGNFSFANKGLTLGDLSGNHFTIVLRDVNGASEEDIHESLQSLESRGFINYFGMQRFGTSSICTHEIGRALISLKFAEAADLVLMPRDGDRADFAAARNHWAETKDIKSTLDKLPRQAHTERKLLSSYLRFDNQHEKAFNSLPQHMLSLYYHAYQSYIWNCAVSERAKIYGCDKPVVGDLVLVDGPEKSNNNSNNNNKKYGNAGRRDHSSRKVPKVLTEEDLDNYTIWDVVYPMPGSRSKYPANAIGDFYKQLLEKDNINIKNAQQHFKKLMGDYRPMMVKPKNVGWKFIRYDNPETKLFNTDYDRITSVPEPVSVPSKSK
ncbi:pseudouridine synthase [Phycomyces blakesleeanus]|uniref:Pseudouridine synthase n=1 Tax=Phycomyces blakesleeanus TaxID=4837 RepID=A0ABR3BDD2_PHYBL